MKNKNITIDDLAVMIQKEFSGIHSRIDGSDSKIDVLANKIDRLEKNDQLILKRLDVVVYRPEFEKLEDRVAELESFITFNTNPKKA
jgi:hypothetical protein